MGSFGIGRAWVKDPVKPAMGQSWQLSVWCELGVA